MTREIKFRAWMKLGKPNMKYDIGGWYISELTPNNDTAIIFMQYTGLKDKNGKEIYEGDIFKCKSGDGKKIMQGEIYFDEGCFKMKYGYQTPMEEDRKDYFLSGKIENDGAEIIEIIGNVWENPELLSPTSISRD